MIENTKDIFYIVLSFCVFWLTFFICWGLYYFVQTLRQTNEMLTNFRNRLVNITTIMDSLKGKAVGFVVKKAMSFMSERKQKIKNKKKE